MAHPLLDVMTDAARGVFPAVDGGVTFLPELPDGNRAVVALTGHAYVAGGLDARDFDGLDLDGFGAAMSPQALLHIADRGLIGVNDVILAAPGFGIGMQTPRTKMWDDHSRVKYARRLRTDVEVYGDERGFVTVSCGLAGRREMSVELANTATSSAGLGRQFITDALRSVPVGEYLFAGVSPGNARSLRSFIAAGFVPLGSEVIIDRSGVSSKP